MQIVPCVLSSACWLLGQGGTSAEQEDAKKPEAERVDAAKSASVSDRQAKLAELKARRKALKQQNEGGGDDDVPQALPTRARALSFKDPGSPGSRARSLSVKSDGSPSSSPRPGRRNVRDIAMLNTTIRNQTAKIASMEAKEAEQQQRIDALEHDLEARGHELRAERLKASQAEGEGDAQPTNVAFLESEAEVTRLHKHVEELAEEHKAALTAAAADADAQRVRADESAAEVEAMRAQIEQLRDILMAQGSSALPANWFEMLMARDGGVAGTESGGADDAGVMAEYEVALEEAYAEIQELRADRGRSKDQSNSLWGTLDEYEQDLAEQKAEMARLQEISANHDKEVMLHLRLEVVRGRLHPLL